MVFLPFRKYSPFVTLRGRKVVFGLKCLKIGEALLVERLGGIEVFFAGF